jgi:SAM-dependent methyltransferase
MDPSDHTDTLDALREHYAAKVREHGDSPAAVQWADRETQERRMDVLAAIGDLRDAKVLDFGCGTGHLLTHLEAHAGFRGEYVGYDLVPEMVELAAAKFPHARFEVVDVLSDPPDAPEKPEEFDYVLVNGTFNNEVNDNWTLLTDLLRALVARARRGVAFNLLSTYVDFRGEGLAYFEPERVFTFCKQEISPYIVLRHDYEVRPGTGPYEMTVYAYTARPT